MEQMKDKKISQSLLKELFDFKIKEQCGIKIVAKYVANIQEEPTDAMRMGNWFEYKCTKQLPRNGEEPLPDTIKSGDLTAPYRRLEKQIENYERIMDAYEIKVLDTGYVFEKHPKASGIADIIAEWDGQKVIIDTKTTAHINNRWEKYGWGDEKFENPDSVEAQHLTIQAVQYKLLAKYEWGIEDIPFYFFVFSTTDEYSCKIFKVDVNPDRLQMQDEQISKAYEYFNKSFIFKTESELANPTMERCATCFLKEKCSEKINVPLIKTIQVW
jgi:hypothetical protein